MSPEGPGNLTGAVGHISHYFAPEGQVLTRTATTASIRIDRLIRFFQDDYSFEPDENEEYLGYWDTCGKNYLYNPIAGQVEENPT